MISWGRCSWKAFLGLTTPATCQALLNETHDYVEFVEEDSVTSLQTKKKRVNKKRGTFLASFMGGFTLPETNIAPENRWLED